MDRKLVLESVDGQQLYPETTAEFVKNLFNVIYPVGSIYISTNDSFNPNNIFDGVWNNFAQGRTIVGKNISDADFNQVLKVGGGRLPHILTLIQQ